MPRKTNFIEDSIDDFTKKKKKGSGNSTASTQDYTGILRQMAKTRIPMLENMQKMAKTRIPMLENMQKMYGTQIKKRASKPRKRLMQ